MGPIILLTKSSLFIKRNFGLLLDTEGGRERFTFASPIYIFEKFRLPPHPVHILHNIDKQYKKYTPQIVYSLKLEGI